MRTSFRRLLPVLALAALGLAAPAFAVDLFVTRYDDPVPGGCDNLGPHETWDCSLREAVNASVAFLTDDRIFLSAGTYELTRAGADEDAGLTGDLDIFGNLEILGPGATMTVIDGNGLDRVLDVENDFNGPTDVIRIAGVTLTGGVDPTLGAHAVRLRHASLTIERSEIRGNGDTAGSSVNALLFASLTIRESTIRDNPGGGLKILQSTGALLNTTVSNNTGFELNFGSEATVLCQHCTIRDDEGDFEVHLGEDCTLQLASSVVIGECSAFGEQEFDSLGGNLESPGATCDFGSGDLENVADHGLSALGWNGGPTTTSVPGFLSPALGLATPLFCAPTDQRGVVRDENTCDAGSVERAVARPPIPIFADGFIQADAEAWSDVVGD